MFYCSLIGPKLYLLAAGVIINLEEPIRVQQIIRVPTSELAEIAL